VRFAAGFREKLLHAVGELDRNALKAVLWTLRDHAEKIQMWWEKACKEAEAGPRRFRLEKGQAEACRTAVK
jgi:hypothetical protein